jgi:predicted  nucleic acid-binding Zn-ribbon protein
LPNDLATLYELQQIDTRIHNLEREREALDSGVELRTQVEALREQAQAAGAELRSREAEMHDAELQMKTREAKKKDFEDKMYSGKVRNPKELDDMQREVQMLSDQISKLEDKALTLMDENEERRAALSAAESELGQQEAGLAQIEERYAAECARIDGEIASLQSQRAEIALSIPSDLLRRYDDLRAKRGNLAVVKMESGVCPGCRVAVSVDTMRRLKRGERVSCESCGRMLYWPNIEVPLNAPPAEEAE